MRSYRGPDAGQEGTRWPGWIETQLVRRGIHSERVLRAFAAVPRAAFVPLRWRALATTDGPLPIGCDQTISQPYIHALCLEALALSPSDTVLDVGTGSGYQAALLSHLAREVYTIEYFEPLFRRAERPIARHARAPVHRRRGDGRAGWPEAAPFAAIVVGARAETLPPALVAQLAVGGRLVIPLGPDEMQVLYCFTKRPDGRLRKKTLDSVRFVPLLG